MYSIKLLRYNCSEQLMFFTHFIYLISRLNYSKLYIQTHLATLSTCETNQRETSLSVQMQIVQPFCHQEPPYVHVHQCLTPRGSKHTHMVEFWSRQMALREDRLF